MSPRSGSASLLPAFMRRGRILPFLIISLSGEIIYGSFEAFKGSLMILCRRPSELLKPSSACS